MRFVIYGAGAIGGVIGGRLFEHGHDVALVARGPHAQVLRRDGLRLESPDGTVTLSIPTVEHPAELSLGADDVVVLATKTQDTPGALDALADAGAEPGAVACAQNGVVNEALALRRFPRVYGICVMCPATHLEPGAVSANSSPVSGILDVGAYPSGVDDRARAISSALAGSTFASVPRPDILRWKYSKLVMNLGNVVEAAFPRSEAATALTRRARHEARACLEAAGIDVASPAEDAERRGDLLTVRPIGDRPRGGGSTWQSLARGATRLETDWFNGEIVLVGRLHGHPTPVNGALQELGHRLSRQQVEPGSLDLDAFLAELDEPDRAEVGDQPGTGTGPGRDHPSGDGPDVRQTGYHHG